MSSQPHAAATPADRLVVTPAAPAEWTAAVAWAAAEGWNPGLRDTDAFLPQDPGGFFLGRLDGEVVSAISVVNYGDEFAFLGFYLVAPKHRGQGLGLATWRAAISHAAAGGVARPIGLDGVVAQQANYERSGFTTAYRTLKYEGVIRPCPRPGTTNPDPDPNTDPNTATPTATGTATAATATTVTAMTGAIATGAAATGAAKTGAAATARTGAGAGKGDGVDVGEGGGEGGGAGVGEGFGMRDGEGVGMGDREVEVVGTEIGLSVFPAREVEFDDLADYDRQCYPAARRDFVARWIAAPGHTALAAVHGETIVGYGVIRPGHDAYRIGPLFADTHKVAAALYEALTADLVGSPVQIDVPEPNHPARNFATERGLEVTLETARMYTAPIEIAAPHKVFSITTLELG